MRTLVRYGYVPVMLIGLNAIAYWVVVSGASYTWLALLLAAAFAIAFFAEWLIPFHEEWNHSHGDVGPTSAHAFVYEMQSVNGVLFIPLIAWMTPWQGIWPHDWPLIAQLLIAIIFADFVFTLIHWISHRVPALWRLHAVHHGVSRLKGMNGMVRHPLHQALDMIFGTLPLVLLGMGVEVAVLLGFAISVQLIVQHSNVDCALGPLRNQLSIGRLHHLHHVNWGTEGDCNYGLFFTLWDRLLGTFHPEPPRRITARDMGIDEVPDFPQESYLKQLIFPFLYTPGQWRAEGKRTEPAQRDTADQVHGPGVGHYQ